MKGTRGRIRDQSRVVAGTAGHYPYRPAPLPFSLGGLDTLRVGGRWADEESRGLRNTQTTSPASRRHWRLVHSLACPSSSPARYSHHRRSTHPVGAWVRSVVNVSFAA